MLKKNNTNLNKKIWSIDQLLELHYQIQVRRLYLIRRAKPRVFIGRQKQKKHLWYKRKTKREQSTRDEDRLFTLRKKMNQ